MCTFLAISIDEKHGTATKTIYDWLKFAFFSRLFISFPQFGA